MRRFLAGLWLLGLALGQGLVLPFEGPKGYGLAQAFAQGLKAPPPPSSPSSSPTSPGGEATSSPGALHQGGGPARPGGHGSGLGAPRTGGGRGPQAHPRPGGRLRGAALQDPRARLALAPGQGARPEALPLPTPGLPEERLRALAQGEAPDPLHRSALDLKEGRGSGLLEGLLPERLLLLWQGKLPRAYEAFRLLAEGKREEALALAEAMEEGDVLERTAAHLLFRALEDERWKASARRLAEAFPELSLAWEEVSFAAFQEGKGEEAKEALLKALALRPDYWLYWTNLGWAYYLTGDLPGPSRPRRGRWPFPPTPPPTTTWAFSRPSTGTSLGPRPPTTGP